MKIQKSLIGFLLLLMVLLPSVAFAGISGPSPVPNPPNFYITTGTTILCKGQTNYVPLTITNKGSQTSVGVQMQNVQLNAVDSKYVSSFTNSTVNAGVINTSNSSTVYLPLFVSSNASSIIPVQVAINYYYYLYYSDSEVRNISFGVQTCPTQLSLSLSPKTLTSAETENLTLNLTNRGSTPITNVSLHLSFPAIDGALLGSQTIQTNLVPVNSTVTLIESLYVYKNASQTFPINLTANYYSDGNFNQVFNSVVVQSSGVINLVASGITLSPQNPTPGSVFSASFVLTDIGTSEASAVTATILPIQGFTGFGSNSVFVGDMQTDTQTPVTLTLTTATSVKNGTYSIPVRINYLNDLRQNISTMVQIPVSIAKTASLNGSAIRSGAYATRGSGSGLIIDIVLIIIIIVLAYLYWRERKRHRSK